MNSRWIVILFLVINLFLALPVLAQNENTVNDDQLVATTSSTNVGADYFNFKKDGTAKAVVLKILEEKIITRENGDKVKQQNVEFQFLEGALNGQRGTYYGASDEIDVVNSIAYNVGDKVLVDYSHDVTGKTNFYITDYVRTSGLFWLVIIFCLIIWAVGGWKGVKAIVALVLSFVAIMYVLVPLVFRGYDPVWVGFGISLLIMLFIIYFTEGFNRKSHVATGGIFISLLVTIGLSALYAGICKLSGTTQEESSYLISVAKVSVDFHGLLLASIIIGTLGVLDDVAIGQVEAVEQIKEANPSLSFAKTFKMAMHVGRSHLGAIINTLFLAYVGASLPLVMLFNIHQEPFLTFSQIINNEDIATEIVRTLVGVVGLCLAVPITTLFAAYFKDKEKK